MLDDDFARQRRNMIDSQVRPGGVMDLRVIAAMASVPREKFVLAEQRAHAYVDTDLPLGADTRGDERWLLAPLTIARMLQLAEIGPEECVLDVGTASGYTAAALSGLAQTVIGIDHDAVLAAQAAERLEKLGYDNVAVLAADHAAGHVKEAPYDAIIINGRIRQRPQALLAQLADGGRLVAVWGAHDTGLIRVWTRRGDAFSAVDEYSASAPQLPGFTPAPAFSF